MGGLHIEMASLNCIRQMLKVTGVDTVIIMAVWISRDFRQPSVMQIRYVVQIRQTVCLSILQQAAYKASLNADKESTFKDWIAHETGVMFRYWNLVLTCIKTPLMFLRSFREASSWVQCLYNLQDLYELKNKFL